MVSRSFQASLLVVASKSLQISLLATEAVKVEMMD